MYKPKPKITNITLKNKNSYKRSHNYHKNKDRHNNYTINLVITITNYRINTNN